MVVLMDSWALWWNGIRDHLQTSRVWAVLGKEVHVAHHHVGGHPGACFSAHPCSSRLKSVPPTTQHPNLRAPQPARKLHGDGHESQVEGHTGSYGRKEAKEASDATATP